MEIAILVFIVILKECGASFCQWNFCGRGEHSCCGEVCCGGDDDYRCCGIYGDICCGPGEEYYCCMKHDGPGCCKKNPYWIWILFGLVICLALILTCVCCCCCWRGGINNGRRERERRRVSIIRRRERENQIIVDSAVSRYGSTGSSATAAAQYPASPAISYYPRQPAYNPGQFAHSQGQLAYGPQHFPQGGQVPLAYNSALPTNQQPSMYPTLPPSQTAPPYEDLFGHPPKT